MAPEDALEDITAHRRSFSLLTTLYWTPKPLNSGASPKPGILTIHLVNFTEGDAGAAVESADLSGVIARGQTEIASINSTCPIQRPLILAMKIQLQTLLVFAVISCSGCATVSTPVANAQTLPSNTTWPAPSAGQPYGGVAAPKDEMAGKDPISAAVAMVILWFTASPSQRANPLGISPGPQIVEVTDNP